jgi:predicted ATPase
VIGGQRALLILDNCERLIRPLAELTNVLLQRTPTLSILATSLQPIGLAGEHIYRLNPLDLPPPGEVDIAHHSAVALFVERARGTDRAFALTDENAPIVGELCRRLDGVPLALEMAVARLPLLGLQGLRQGLAERLRMLAPGRRYSLSHHSSLRSMVEWSYELLDPPSARLFRRLAIFAGSFSLDAAVAVGGSDEIDHWDTLDALGQLIDRSLVIAEPVEPPRYRLLETLRLFASEHLRLSGEHDLCSRRHADFYCDFLEDIVECEEAISSDIFLGRFGAELDNVRAALDWALADGSRSDIAITLGGGLFHILLWLNLYPEATFYYERLSPLIPGRPTSLYLARLFRGAGTLIGQGEMKEGAHLLRLSVDAYARLGFPLLAAAAQVALASVNVGMGNVNESASLNGAAQVTLEGSNFMLSRIRTLTIEGYIALYRNDLQRAKMVYVKALELSRSSKHVSSSNTATMAIPVIEYAEGNFAAAVEMGQLAVEAMSSTRHESTLALAQANQSIFLCMAGRVAEARTMAEQAVPLSQASGSRSVLNCVLAWVLLLATEGHHREAAQLLGFVREGNVRAGITPGPFQDRTYERIRAILSENMSPDELSANAKIGAAWTADQALTFALGAGRARGIGREASNFGEPAPSAMVGRRSADLNRSALH